MTVWSGPTQMLVVSRMELFEAMREDENGRFYVPRDPRPGSEHLALGEGGGYQDDGDDNWPGDWLEDLPDAA